MIILMQCLNEEFAVKRCISDFHDEAFVDKIIVIDGGSTDYTVEELKSFSKVQVHVHPWLDHYHAMNAMQRNIGLSYVNEGEVFFMLDFDERLTPPLKKILSEIDEKSWPYGLSHVPRRTIEILRYPESTFAIYGGDGWPIESHQIGQFPDPQPRLIRKKLGMCWVNSPHHVLMGVDTYGKDVFAPEQHILHYEKDDARLRHRIERKWAREQAARLQYGVKPDVFETKLRPEVAKYGVPEGWKND